MSMCYYLNHGIDRHFLVTHIAAAGLVCSCYIGNANQKSKKTYTENSSSFFFTIYSTAIMLTS